MPNDIPTRQEIVDHKTVWQQLYRAGSKGANDPRERIPGRCLAMMVASGARLHDPIIDIGAGDSTLVDELLERGHSDITVLDISSEVLKRVATQVRERRSYVKLMNQDVRTLRTLRSYAVWHDRATFHFMVSEADREGYRNALHEAIGRGGRAIIVTPGPEGPAESHGLPVCRYDADSLARPVGQNWQLVNSCVEVHQGADGEDRQYLYATFQRAVE